MGYSASAWTDFAVAVAGAAAALSGLLFVAVSINLSRILAFPNLPARAGQTLIMLVTPLIVALLVLIPDQRPDLLGVELLVGAALLVPALGWLNRPSTRSVEEDRVGYAVSRIAPAVLVVGFLGAAGISLLALAGGGLYWIAPAVVIAIVAGLGNAWVLLVEIQR
jgi:modulator of FtsH protease